MDSKLLTEGLQRILETYDDEDCPHENYYREILTEAIEREKGCSQSELNDGVMKPAMDCLERRIEELKNNTKEAEGHGDFIMQDLCGRTISSYKMVLTYLKEQAL